MVDILTFGVSGILTIIAILTSIVLFILTIVFGIIRIIKTSAIIDIKKSLDILI